jgi:hypothetical protein
MNCDPDTINCQLDRIADAAESTDVAGLGLSLLATFFGVLIPILIAYFAFRTELKLRREERREDAFSKVIDAIAKLSADIWEHEHRMAALLVAAVKVEEELVRDVAPDGPLAHGVRHAVLAARVVAKGADDRVALVSALSQVESAMTLDGWIARSYGLTQASNQLSNHIRNPAQDAAQSG